MSPSAPEQDASGPIQTSRHEGVFRIRLNRPKALNALDVPLVEGLSRALDEAEADDGIRVVLLVGHPRSFCAGGDLRTIAAATQGVEESLGGLADLFHAVIRKMDGMRKPVLVGISGVAAGGGLSLALAADLRVMAEGSILKQAYTSNGLSPDGGGSYMLVRALGLSKALEVALLDPVLEASEAQRLGLVSRVFPQEGFEEACLELAKTVAKGSLQSLSTAKRLMRSAANHLLSEHLDCERDGIVACATSAEGQEGIQAFLEKRKPRFWDAS